MAKVNVYNIDGSSSEKIDLPKVFDTSYRPDVIRKTFKEMGLKDGYVGDPSRADSDYGRWYFNETVNVYVKSAIDLYAGKKQLQLPKNVKLIMKSLFWQ